MTCWALNNFRSNYKKCVKWLAKGMVLPIACHKFIIHTSQLNQLTLEISASGSMNLEKSPFVTAARGVLLPELGKHLSSVQPYDSQQNRIIIRSVVREPCIDQRFADMQVEGLHYKLLFSNLPVSWGAHWAPRTATHMGTSNLQSYSRKWYNRKSSCELNFLAIQLILTQLSSAQLCTYFSSMEFARCELTKPHV